MQNPLAATVAVSSGKQAQLTISSGALVVGGGVAISGGSVNVGSATHITSGGTSGVILSAGGVLNAVAVNSGGTGAALTLRDGAVVNSGGTVAVIDASTKGGIVYNASLVSGLNYTLNSGADITVIAHS